MTDRPLILDYPSSTTHCTSSTGTARFADCRGLSKRKKKNEESPQNIQRLATAPLSRAVRAFHNALDMVGFFFLAFPSLGQVVNVNDNLSGHI